MNSKKEDVTENTNSTLWRTVFLSLVFGTLTLIVALSVFFYIRTREPMWDNRAGVSRLVVINRSSQRKFGTEVFTMFGSEEITLNGQTIQDENTIYIGNGGILVLEIVGVSRDGSNDELSTYSSKILVSRKGGNTIVPMDSSGSNTSPSEVVLSPSTGSFDPLSISLVDSRIEIRGMTGKDSIVKIQATGWYP